MRSSCIQIWHGCAGILYLQMLSLTQFLLQIHPAFVNMTWMFSRIEKEPKLPKSRDEMKPHQYSVTSTAPAAKASGIYTWVISTDTVYSDSLAAEMFGFSPAEARGGLPLKDYLSRMHADDLPRVAKAIHDTMLSGEPYSEQYRICRPDGSIVEIMAFGSCFRDGTGEPSHYSGIIFPVGAMYRQDSTIISHLLAAYDLARREGKGELAKRIVNALAETGWRETDSEAIPLGAQLH